METPEIPVTFEAVMEIPNGVLHPTKPIHIEIGIMFKYIHTSPDMGGWAPQIIYCKNLQTGKDYSRNEAARIIHPARLQVALDTIGWQLDNDPDADEQDREVFREICGIPPQ